MFSKPEKVGLRRVAYNIYNHILYIYTYILYIYTYVCVLCVYGYVWGPRTYWSKLLLQSSLQADLPCDTDYSRTISSGIYQALQHLWACLNRVKALSELNMESSSRNRKPFSKGPAPDHEPPKCWQYVHEFTLKLREPMQQKEVVRRIKKYKKKHQHSSPENIWIRTWASQLWTTKYHPNPTVQQLYHISA